MRRSRDASGIPFERDGVWLLLFDLPGKKIALLLVEARQTLLIIFLRDRRYRRALRHHQPDDARLIGSR